MNKLACILILISAGLCGCSETKTLNAPVVHLKPLAGGEPMKIDYSQEKGDVKLTAENVGEVTISDKTRVSGRQFAASQSLQGWEYARTNTMGGSVASTIGSRNEKAEPEAIKAVGGAIGEAAASAAGLP